MKLLTTLCIAIVGILSRVWGEQSPSAGTGGVSAANAVLSRDAVVPLTVVTRFFPEITQEMSTGQNPSAVGKPKATRSVIYANSDNSKKVTISVDQHVSPSNASAAYQQAVQ